MAKPSGRRFDRTAPQSRPTQRRMGESLMTRLQAPVGFNDRPYRCCCFRPQHKMICMFTISLLLGVGMVTGGTFATVHGYYICVWALGGVIKLGGATLCMLAMMRPTRNYILAYLTETVMEITLVFLGLIALIFLMLMDAGKLEWTTPEESGKWFSSAVINAELKKAAEVTDLKSGLLLGLAFLALLLLKTQLIIQIIGLYRFSNYVQDRTDFMMRSASRRSTDTTVAPFTAMTRGGPTANSGATFPVDTRMDNSRTLARPPRDETWVASTKLPPKVPPKEPPKEPPKPSTLSMGGPKTPPGKVGVPQASTAAGAGAGGYASVYPPSPSEVELQDKEKARHKRHRDHKHHR